jgi:hypothetical protein
VEFYLATQPAVCDRLAQRRVQRSVGPFKSLQDVAFKEFDGRGQLFTSHGHRPLDEAARLGICCAGRLLSSLADAGTREGSDSQPEIQND